MALSAAQSACPKISSSRSVAQVAEREGPLRKAQALLRRLRERDLYKYVDVAQVPVEHLQKNMCALYITCPHKSTPWRITSCA